MNKEPVIIQFDEDESFFTVVDLICFNMELNLTAKAKNIEEAREIVRKVESGALKPDIAIIGDYLGNNFQDGFLLQKKLRSLKPDLKIVAYVSDAEIEWGDELAIKGSRNAEQTLTMALSKLTGKTFKASNIEDLEQ